MLLAHSCIYIYIYIFIFCTRRSIFNFSISEPGAQREPDFSCSIFYNVYRSMKILPPFFQEAFIKLGLGDIEFLWTTKRLVRDRLNEKQLAHLCLSHEGRCTHRHALTHTYTLQRWTNIDEFYLAHGFYRYFIAEFH